MTAYGPPVAVVVLVKRHEYQCEKRHDWLDQAELQRRLLAEAQKLDGVLLASQTARARHVIGRPEPLNSSLVQNSLGGPFICTHSKML